MVAQRDPRDYLPNDLYRVQHAADYIGVHRNTFMQWMKQPDFPVRPFRTVTKEALFTLEMLDEVRHWKHPVA